MKQYIYGHRGASGYAPENTLEAFKMAADMGAEGVELDVHICRSGELVVAHDEGIERVSDGTGLIKDMTLKELKALHFNRTHPEYKDARIPTLQEVFQLLKPTGLKINCELKNSVFDYPQLEERVIGLAIQEGMLDRILFSSFNHHSMLRVKALDKKLYCGLLYEATLVKPWAYAVALGMDAIHPHFTEVLVPGGYTGDVHRAGIQINTWTVNREEDIDAVLKAGADILITNYPDRALKIRDEGLEKAE
ncbi:MAG: glycerophosphodiester phosphodiesterase [Clostridia bacterium]|nr:glycerophosphodiester phosphodiesterase [Clostridia bacterium]